jgi:hypothetical protein
MKTRTASPWKFLEPRQKLDMQTLNESVRQDARNLRPWLDQMEENQRTRDCVWNGQSPDGRKRARYLGEAPQPWEGASDARIPVADEIIREIKLVMTSAQRAGQLEVKGHHSDQDSSAALVTPVLNYVLGTQMRSEVFTQPELMADFALEHGVGFMHVGWRVTRDLEEREVTVEELLAFALEMTPRPEVETEEEAAMVEEQIVEMAEMEMWDLLLDPARRPQLVERLLDFDDAMTRAEAERVASALQRGQPATYFRPYVRENRPTWEALCLGSDLTLPPSSMADIQRAPRVTRWRWLTEAQLYDLGTIEGWDKEGLEIVAKNPGAMWSDWAQEQVPAWVLGTMGVGAAWSNEDAKSARLYHVAETWQRLPTKAGPSALFRTIHHAAFKERPLLHEVCKDKHGKLPIVSLRAENRSKLLVQARGIAARAMSWQSSIKLQHDAQDDSTMLRTTPPLQVPRKRFGSTGTTGSDGQGSLPISPFSQLPIASGPGEQYQWLDVQGAPVESARIQNDLRVQFRRYFGLADPAVPPVVTQMHQQGVASDFLATLAAAVDMTFQLCQQYMDPIVGARIAGLPFPLTASREDIQGEWSMDITYDVKEMDLDWLTKKFDLLAKMMQFDSGGFVKRGELMKYVFSAADPVLAKRIVVDDEGGIDAATQDEKSVIAAQVSGQRVTGRLESPMSRLAAHEQWLQNPEALTTLQQRPMLLEVELARVEALEFQQEQQTTNAATGRTGEAAMAPWEEGQKLSDRIKAMFGLNPSSPAAQPFDPQTSPQG